MGPCLVSYNIITQILTRRSFADFSQKNASFFYLSLVSHFECMGLVFVGIKCSRHTNKLIPKCILLF